MERGGGGKEEVGADADEIRIGEELGGSPEGTGVPPAALEVQSPTMLVRAETLRMLDAIEEEGGVRQDGGGVLSVSAFQQLAHQRNAERRMNRKLRRTRAGRHPKGAAVRPRASQFVFCRETLVTETYERDDADGAGALARAFREAVDAGRQEQETMRRIKGRWFFIQGRTGMPVETFFETLRVCAEAAASPRNRNDYAKHRFYRAAGQQGHGGAPCIAGDYLMIVTHEISAPWMYAEAPPLAEGEDAGAFRHDFKRVFRGHHNSDTPSSSGAPGAESAWGGLSAASEEYRVVQDELHHYLFPDVNLLVTVAGENYRSPYAMWTLLSTPRSMARRLGCARHLLACLIESECASITPVLTNYGDALEVIENLNSVKPDQDLVGVVQKAERDIHDLRQHMWAMVKLLQALRRDIYGVMLTPYAMQRSHVNAGVDENGYEYGIHSVADALALVQGHVEQVEAQASSYLGLARSIEDYFTLCENRRNQAVIFVLTAFTVPLAPIQTIAGIYGMNFANMPELDYQHGYAIFWAANLVIFALVVVVGYLWQRTGDFETLNAKKRWRDEAHRFEGTERL